MAVTFLTGSQQDRIVVSGTPDVTTQVTFHQNTRTVFLKGFDAAGTSPALCKYALVGVDDAAIESNFSTVPAGATAEVRIANRGRVLGGKSLYIASLTISGTIEVEASEFGGE